MPVLSQDAGAYTAEQDEYSMEQQISGLRCFFSALKPAWG